MSYLTPTSTKLVAGLIPPEQCDHQSTPLSVIEVEDGYFRAQCLTCGSVGPVQQSPQAARQELMDEGVRSPSFSSASEPALLFGAP
jgi:hypothetical protein